MITTSSPATFLAPYPSNNLPYNWHQIIIQDQLIKQIITLFSTEPYPTIIIGEERKEIEMLAHQLQWRLQAKLLYVHEAHRSSERTATLKTWFTQQAGILLLSSSVLDESFFLRRSDLRMIIHTYLPSSKETYRKTIAQLRFYSDMAIYTVCFRSPMSLHPSWSPAGCRCSFWESVNKAAQWLQEYLPKKPLSIDQILPPTPMQWKIIWKIALEQLLESGQLKEHHHGWISSIDS